MRGRWSAGVVALLGMVLVAAPGTVGPSHARAQSEVPSQGEPAGYRATVEEALQEFEARNFEESRALFARAHALYPNARTLRGLGFAEFELRNYRGCIEQLEAALSSSVRPLQGELRSSTEQLLARAHNFVARVFLDVKPGMSQLTVDGVRVDAPAGQPLLLQVGEHTLEVQSTGFRPERRRLTVSGGSDQTLTILLEKTDSPEPARSARRWYKSPWLWGTLGVVVLGAAGTTLALTLGGGTTQEKANGGSADAVLMGPSK